MESTADRTPATERTPILSRLPIPMLFAAGLLLAFLAAPWSLEHKAHAALHGLCAQTPSHTFSMGGRPLPFDARMTGIYGGFAFTFATLILMGRHRAAKLPSYSLMALLALLVGAMAVDGFNSLFFDLGRPHPYHPDNRLRLATGIGTGAALATILSYLVAVTLWRRPDLKLPVLTWKDLGVILPVQVPFALLVLTGWGWLSAPLTVGLVLAALGVLTTLILVALVLLRRLESSFDHASELQLHSSVAIVFAVAIMASLAAGRFLLEDMTGIRAGP